MEEQEQQEQQPEEQQEEEQKEVQEEGQENQEEKTEGEEGKEPASEEPEKKGEKEDGSESEEEEKEEYEEYETEEEEEDENGEIIVKKVTKTRLKKKKKKEKPLPPVRKPPARAPPPTPVKVYALDKELWSQGPRSNRVWEVDQEEEYQEEAPPSAVDLSDTPVAQKYEVGEVIGKGFFSEVKKATSKSDRAQVAIKVVTSQLTDAAREIDILQKASGGPNILQLIESIDTDQGKCIITPLAKSGDLVKYLLHNNGEKGAKHNEANARKIGHAIASALAYLHEHDILHGDLAPENILLDCGKYEVCLGGFSNARVCKSGAKDEGNLIGTAQFQAPEVNQGESFGKSSDCWALGCILYFLIAGKSPFEDSNTMRMNMKIRQATLEFDDDWKDVDASVKDLISSLVKVKPENRAAAKDVVNHSWFKSSSAKPLPSFYKNLSASS